MTRLQLTFGCGEWTLAGTLDAAPGGTGLLLVSGGNEIRAGSFNGQAGLAADIAAEGFPVFRFDRRGIGDSEGENRGFRKSGKDIASAIGAFRAIAPRIDRVVAFGNCDAASALMLTGGAGCDALVLSNPWVVEDGDAVSMPPPSAIRARYSAKLRNPREVMRLVTGGVNLSKLAAGLMRAGKRRGAASTLAGEMAAGLAGFTGPVRILLAETDRTAQTFAETWDRDDPRIARCPRADHAYSEPHAREWLRQQLLAALRS